MGQTHCFEGYQCNISDRKYQRTDKFNDHVENCEVGSPIAPGGLAINKELPENEEIIAIRSNVEFYGSDDLPTMEEREYLLNEEATLNNLESELNDGQVGMDDIPTQSSNDNGHIDHVPNDNINMHRFQNEDMIIVLPSDDQIVPVAGSSLYQL